MTRTPRKAGGIRPAGRRVLVVLVAASAWIAGCSDDGGAAPDSPVVTTSAVDSTGTTTTAAVSPLSSLVQPAGDARYDPDDHRPLPAPVAVTISAVGVDRAPVVAVGVDEAGALDVPGATEVGWYRFGAVPGDRGSSVLAAHIAYNGRDGVFRHLDRLTPGDRVDVAFADGSSRGFVVERRAQYDKDSLPDDLFSSDGDSRLVLITCGGSFNPDLRSYEDNVVVYAVPG